MRKVVEKKIKGGKLLRVEFEESDDRILDIKITGDFFIHPEEAITDIENLIKGNKISEIEKELKDYVQKNEIEIIGFGVQHLLDILLHTI